MTDLSTPPTAAFTDAEDFDLTLEAGRAEKHYWRDVWKYRELFFLLAHRDIAVRYKQTVVGVAWALIQPLTTMIIMTVIFGRVAGLKSEGSAPYPVMVFAAMLPWTFFSSALGSASQSMVNNSNLISKVYFPRLIVPASAVVTAFADLLVQMLILVGMMVWYQVMPTWHILVIPPLIALTFFIILGPGLLLTALNAKYRDLRFVMPFITQVGLYISPVAYSSTVIRQKLGDTLYAVYCLNPMAGIIDGFRWAVLGDNTAFNYQSLGTSIVITVILSFIGIWYFRKTEKSMSDIL